MTESRFAAEVCVSIRRLPNTLCERHEGRYANAGPRYTPSWDAYALRGGEFFALEFKVFRGASYPIAKIPERQVLGLGRARACGARGVAFVVRGKGPEALVLSPEAMSRAIQEAKDAGRKSVTWAALLQSRTTMVLRNGGEWNVAGILAAAER